MDETTYSDRDVIDTINSGFIPIRVDTDQRPDVNSRYNMGGWPTTAILTPDGRILTGGTYIPAPRMKRLLTEALAAVSRGAVNMGLDPFAYDPSEDDSADEPEWDSPNGVQEPETYVDDGELWDIYEWIRDDLIDGYDSEYGGFGTQPKFPMVEALRFAMLDYTLTGNPQMVEILTNTLSSMANGGIYDQVEGGFFRYSTTRNWGIPHFEKMLEDNSLLLHLLIDAYKLTRNETFLSTALDTLRYLEVRLFQQHPPSFCGSQDADESYYSMDATGRRRMTAPYIDPNVYAAWNALAVQAILNVWTVTGDESHLGLALTVANTLRTELYDPEVGVYHYLESDAGRRKSPLTLDDQLRFTDMALRVFAVTGNGQWRDDAIHMIDLVMSHYTGKDGLLSDTRPDTAMTGPLQTRRYDFHENARAATTLSSASTMLERDDLREIARHILASLKQSVYSYGAMAAEFGLAVQDALRPWTRVTVVGCFSPADGVATRDFLRTLHSRVFPQFAVAPLDINRDRQAIENLGIPIGQIPVAVACVGKKCLQPQTDAESLLSQLDQVSRKSKGTDSYEYEDYKERRQEITNLDLGNPQ